MRRNDRVCAGGILALALTLGGASAVSALEAVGLVAPDGGACFVKRFNLQPGAVIEGIEFASNDTKTVFAKVALIRGPVERLADGEVLWETRNARSTFAHRVGLAVPNVRMESAQEVLVAVYLPASDGVRDVGEGAALGATPGANFSGSFIAPSVDATLQPIQMDLAINVTLAGAGKAALGQQVAASFSLEARSPEVDTADIRFSVPSAGPVSLSIYDVAGREVRQLVRGELASGDHSRIWDGRDSHGHLVGSGVYVIKLQAAHRDASQKVVLLR